MARPATTTNFILEQLRKVGIIGETDEKLAQVYDGYETDDKKYLAVCRSYLIDYYCAVVTDQKRVEILDKKFAVFNVEQLDDILTAIKDSSTPEHHKTMLQSYLEKKKLSCKRAKALGFSDAEVKCLQYSQDLEAFLAYVSKRVKQLTVDVSFVGTIDKDKYDNTKYNTLELRADLTFYLKTDLQKHSIYSSSFELKEAKKLVEYGTKIDVLKHNGGFAISFGNGRDGYKTTFELLAQFIAANWEITEVEMLYPDNIKFTSIKDAPNNIKGKLSMLDLDLDKEHMVPTLKKIVENKESEESDYFNGTMLITLVKSDAEKLTIWTLASREDFHDIAIQNSTSWEFREVEDFAATLKKLVACIRTLKRKASGSKSQKIGILKSKIADRLQHACTYQYTPSENYITIIATHCVLQA